MEKKSKGRSRTPLKARAQPSPAQMILSENDDEFERAQARAARAAASKRKSLLSNFNADADGREEDLLGKDQILELFHNCIKLASENKINQRNTWDLSLIDHLSDIIKVEEQDTETNFQKASCTLEAGVKIYSMRVDSVHSDAYKVLGGINRTGKETGEKEDVEEGQTVVTDEDEGDNNQPQKKISDPSATLEASFEALNVKKFDVAFTVDPLYHQTSAQFDEGGAKGLLLNTLSVYNDCRIVFDSWEVPETNMKSALSQNNDSFDTINMLFIEDCIKQMVIGFQSNREISPMLQEILRFLEDPYRKSAEAIASMEDNDDTLSSSIDSQESYDREDCTDNSFNDVELHDFDCDENVGDIEDDLNTLHFDTHSSLPHENNKTEVRLGYGEFEFEDDKDVLSEQTLEYLFLGMGASSKSNAWAGPEHWKYRKGKDVHQSSDSLNETSTRDNKSKKKKREPFSIDFLNTSETANVASFAPPKNQRFLLLPQNNTASCKTTLPEDCHYQSEEFVKLFLLPSVMCIRRKGRNVHDESFEHTNGFEPSCTWGNENVFDANWDDAQVDSDMEDSNVNMVVQPRKVQKIEVDYDKTSKQVDVHVLKRNLWDSIQDFCKENYVDNKQKPDMSFKGLLSDFPTNCQAAAAEDISVHLCFICLLHLANEYCLTIQDQPSLDELYIQIPLGSLKEVIPGNGYE